MVHQSLGLQFSSDGSQLPGSLKWPWAAQWYWCEKNKQTLETLKTGKKNILISLCLSYVSLLVFLLQGLLQVLDWAGDRDRDRGEGDLWTDSLKLLLHVNILKLLLLSDACHLLNLFLCHSQTLTQGKKTKWDNYQSKYNQSNADCYDCQTLGNFLLYCILDNYVLHQNNLDKFFFCICSPTKVNMRLRNDFNLPTKVSETNNEHTTFLVNITIQTIKKQGTGLSWFLRARDSTLLGMKQKITSLKEYSKAI